MSRSPLPQVANESALEERIVKLDEQLTDEAFEKFTEGDVSHEQLKQFYEALHVWSKASEKVIELMRNTGIKG